MRHPESVPESLKDYTSVAVIGRGQVGSMLSERFRRDPGARLSVAGRGEIRNVMADGPEVVIAATPYPVHPVVTEIVRRSIRPFTLVLPQNGVGVLKEARAAAGSAPVSLIRASLFAAVYRTGSGVRYDSRKLRVALADTANGAHSALFRVQQLFDGSGFDTMISHEPYDLEWTKLLINTIGSTSTVTGLPPSETFRNPDLFAMEIRGLKDRIRIIGHSPYRILSIPWAHTDELKIASRMIPEHVPQTLRTMIADLVSAGRDDLPSAAARKIAYGDSTQEMSYYHIPFIIEGGKHGLDSPVDRTMLQILTDHLEGELDLSSMTSSGRTDLLIETFRQFN